MKEQYNRVDDILRSHLRLVPLYMLVALTQDFWFSPFRLKHSIGRGILLGADLCLWLFLNGRGTLAWMKGTQRHLTSLQRYLSFKPFSEASYTAFLRKRKQPAPLGSLWQQQASYKLLILSRLFVFGKWVQVAYLLGCAILGIPLVCGLLHPLFGQARLILLGKIFSGWAVGEPLCVVACSTAVDFLLKSRELLWLRQIEEGWARSLQGEGASETRMQLLVESLWFIELSTWVPLWPSLHRWSKRKEALISKVKQQLEELTTAEVNGLVESCGEAIVYGWLSPTLPKFSEQLLEHIRSRQVVSALALVERFMTRCEHPRLRVLARACRKELWAILKRNKELNLLRPATKCQPGSDLTLMRAWEPAGVSDQPVIDSRLVSSQNDGLD